MSISVFNFAILFILLHQISSPAMADLSSICKLTLYPEYCEQVLGNSGGEASVFDYSFLALNRSISRANDFRTKINNYISSSGFTQAHIRALLDCHLLVDFNLDYLTNSFGTLSAANNDTLSDDIAYDVQTQLSATLTNQQTCLESILSAASDWSVITGFSSLLSLDIKLYSVCLELISKGWIPKKARSKGSIARRNQSAFGHGSISLRTSERVRKIFESVRRKKLFSGDRTVNVSDIVIVSQDGTGNFTTIMEAVAAAPNKTDGSTGYFMIYITAGVYEEYVTIDKPKKYILMIGDGINQTIITGNRSVAEGWTTFSSGTFTVMGKGFVGVDMSIRNTAGAIKHQAVALRNNADLSTFYRCSFEGYQDTLYVHSLRQFYRECYIYGTIDFIFGNSAALFQNSYIFPRLPLKGQFNTITAQGRTDPNQNTGISILDCLILPSDKLISSNRTVSTYLGRPWKEYSRTVFMLSYLDGFIDPAGWSVWNGTFALDTLYYGEFDNRGPDSNTINRVTWPGYHVMSDWDAEDFTVSNILLGDYWLPQTGVPYYGGLHKI